MIFHILLSQDEHEAQWHQVAKYNLKNSSTSLSEELHEFSDYDFIELQCSLRKTKTNLL